MASGQDGKIFVDMLHAGTKRKLNDDGLSRKLVNEETHFDATPGEGKELPLFIDHVKSGKVVFEEKLNNVKTPCLHSTAIGSDPSRSTQSLNMAFGVANAKGLRNYMEDRHTIVSPFFLLGSDGNVLPEDGIARSFAAVFDGHNGTLAADIAANRLHDILAREPAFQNESSIAMEPELEMDNIRSSFVNAFETVDNEVLERCRTEKVRGGATGVVLVRMGEMLYAAHCGDSRAVLYRSGRPIRLTEDHKPNLPRERQRVESNGGIVDFAHCWRVIIGPKDGRPASGLAVSRSLGDLDFKEPLPLIVPTPDVVSERLMEDDRFVILASDGLWDVLRDEDACELVCKEMRIAQAVSKGRLCHDLLASTAAESLVKSSLKAGTMDNVTVVVGIFHYTAS